jgi:flagellar basal-body rod protein FlgF
MEEGPLHKTGNRLDVAIHGQGWFGVQTANGLRYTRDGAFTLNSNGELVTSSGDKVASAGGGTITIPNTARDITITDGGTIETDQGTAGNLMVVSFQNEQQLKPEGDNLYNTTETGAPSYDNHVIQGALEGSNVQPVMEMTRMIDVSRAYQATQQMMMDEHNRLRDMIQRMTQNS